MSERDGVNINAVIEQIETVLRAHDLPGKHPGVLRSLETLISQLVDHDIATDKCADLRAIARRFYASDRTREMSEVDYDHNWMIGCVVSMQMHVAMLKYQN